MKTDQMKTKKGYMIVNKNGNPTVLGAQLPIFWYKKTAKRFTDEHEGLKIVTVDINYIP